MNLETLPDELYQQFATLGQALSNDTRLRILNLLAQTERSVDDLASQLGQSVANTSAHLRVLRTAHLVDSRKDGRRVYYRLGSTSALKLWLALRDVGLERSPEAREAMRALASEPGLIPDLGEEELLNKVERGEILLLDLRPAEEYNAGHIPNALSIPHDELSQRIDELPQDREIVAYCRGPYCVAAIRGVEILRDTGRQARRLGPGIAEWIAAGRPVDEPEPA